MQNLDLRRGEARQILSKRQRSYSKSDFYNSQPMETLLKQIFGQNDESVGKMKKVFEEMGIYKALDLHLFGKEELMKEEGFKSNGQVLNQIYEQINGGSLVQNSQGLQPNIMNMSSHQSQPPIQQQIQLSVPPPHHHPDQMIYESDSQQYLSCMEQDSDYEECKHQTINQHIQQVKSRSNILDNVNMPPCFLKSILAIQELLIQKMESQETNQHFQTQQQPQSSDQDINTQFQMLTSRFKIEQLEDELKLLIESSYSHYQKGEYDESKMDLDNALMIVRPFDIMMLKQLISNIEISAQQVQGKKIVLLIGGSGVGKSTTIHYLAGSKLQQTRIKGINHLEPVNVKNEELKRVRTSPTCQSETRFITPVTVSFESLGSYSSEEIIYCDSPGLVDTNGPEVDIANGIGILRAIHKCYAVKPVIVISNQMGDRMQVLENITNILVKMIPDIKSHLSQFTYFFTKHSPEEAEQIFPKLEDFYLQYRKSQQTGVSKSITQNQLASTDKQDNFKILFEDILNKIKQNNGPVVIDPLRQKPDPLYIAKLFEELPGIEDPELFFKNFTSEQSQTALDKQVLRHQQQIEQCLANQEFEMIIFLLDELQFLFEVLENDYIKLAMSDSIKAIVKALLETYHSGKRILGKAIEKQNQLGEEDLQTFVQGSDMFLRAEELIQKYLISLVPHSDAFNVFINEQVTLLATAIKSNDEDLKNTKIQLDKMRFLGERFKIKDFDLSQILDHYKQKFDSSIKLFQDSISSQQYIQGGEQLVQVYLLNKKLSEIPEFNNFDQLFQDQRIFLIQHLKDQVSGLSKIFTKYQVDQADIRAIQQLLSSLGSIKTIGVYIKVVGVETLQEFSNFILLQAEKLCKTIVEAIEKKSLDKYEFNSIQDLVTQLDQLREIPQIEQNTNAPYFALLSNLGDKINFFKNDIQQIIDQIKINHSLVDYEKLLESLSFFNQAQWINKYKPGLYQDNFTQINKFFTTHQKELIKKYKTLNLDFNSPSEIQKADKIVTELTQIETFKDLLPSLEVFDSLKEFKTDIEKELGQIMKEINEYYDKQNSLSDLRLDHIEKQFLYVQACYQIGELRDQSREVMNSLQKLIEDLKSTLVKEFSQNFQLIKSHKMKDEEEKKELQQAVSQILNRFTQITMIKNECRVIFNLFDKESKIEKVWIQNINSFLDDLSTRMTLCKQNKDNAQFSTLLFVLMNLQQFDEFLGDRFCQKLYYESKLKHIEYSYQELKERTQTIQSHDFVQTRCILEDLKGDKDQIRSNHFKELKKILNKSLAKLVEDTKRMSWHIVYSDNLTSDRSQGLADELAKVQNALSYVSEFIEDQNSVQECLKDVKSRIQKALDENLKKVEGQIIGNNFCEAEKALSNLSLINLIFEKFTTEEITSQIKKIKDSKKEKLMKIVKEYEQMEVENYIYNQPKEIFEKLDINKNGEHSEILKTIETNILKQFRKKIQTISELQSINERKQSLKKLEPSLKCLPYSIKVLAQDDLQSAEEGINQDFQIKENTLIKALHQNDLKSIEKILAEEKQTGTNTCFYPISTYIKERVKDLKSNLEMYIQRGELEETFKKLTQFDEIKSLFSQDFESIINQAYDEIQHSVHNLFTGYIQNTLQVISTDHFKREIKYIDPNRMLIDQDSSETMPPNYLVQQKQSSLQLAIQFMSLREEKKQMFDPQHNYDSLFTQLLKKLNQYFSECQEEYQKAFGKKIDFGKLDMCLRQMENFQGQFDVLRTYVKKNDKKPEFSSLVSTFIDGIGLKQMEHDIVKNLTEVYNYMKDYQLLNDKTKSFEPVCIEQYKQVGEKLSILEQASSKLRHKVDFDSASCLAECNDRFEKQIQLLIQQIQIALIQDNSFDIKPCQELNIAFINLKCACEFLPALSRESKSEIEKLKDQLNKIVNEFFLSIKSNASPSFQDICHMIIQLKIIGDNISYLKDQINGRLEKSLTEFKQTHGPQSLAKLAVLLSANPIGKNLIDELKVFSGHQIFLFNQKVQKHGIKYVLDNLEGNNLWIELLNKKYIEFTTLYQNLVSEGLRKNANCDTMVSFVKGQCQPKPPSRGQKIVNIFTKAFDKGMQDKVPKLVAYIFAVWTLKNSTYYFEMSSSSNGNDSYLFTPHPAQVISIFRMLGVGYKNANDIENNLIQIGTGEGKSVTLAITACILALFGFEVNVACYSQYLSQRDYNAFKLLFETFGVQSLIKYGTFNELCEQIINQDGEIRTMVENLILKGQFPPKKKQVAGQKQQRVLLIDEVDVFFSKDYYGNLYNPSASLRHEKITNLIVFIWNNKDSLDYAMVKVSQEFKECLKIVNGFDELIHEVVKCMLNDLKFFQQNHPYIILDDKLAYKEQDQYVTDLSFGFRTLFAYFHEAEMGRISQKSLADHIDIVILCGSYSYSEIVREKDQFKYILGVSGTLKSMTEDQRKIVEEEYNIKGFSYMPSVFGQNNLTFSEMNDICIENQDDFHPVIRKKIDDRMKGKNNQDVKRAMLIFFESKTELQQFYESEAFMPIKHLSRILTEEASTSEKESIIKYSTLQGQITLLTKAFSRGTDFVCRDELVNSNGGVDVIQTYLSENRSEEIQTKGRTARQGEHGSYCMVLQDLSLECFLISKEDIQINRGNLYSMLDQKRNEQFNQSYADNKQYLNERANAKHIQALKFVTHLRDGKMKEVKAYLTQMNSADLPALNESIQRTICLMDATSSMTNLLEKSKNAVEKMFCNITEILKTQNIHPNCFQLQFAVFRNYNSKEDEILEASTWESRPENLRNFIAGIGPKGGWEDEAVEIGLWHCVNEANLHEVSQVILIGDSMPNSKHNVSSKRVTSFGESYWSQTKFSAPTHYTLELNKLIEKGIKVHAFYVAEKAKESFEEIASQSDGRCQALDINSDEGAKDLTDLVSEEVLRVTSRKLGLGDALVEQYQVRFGKTYV